MTSILATTVLTITACGVALESSPAPTAERSTTRAAEQSPATTRQDDPAATTFLHQVDAESGRGSGDRTSATLDGDPSQKVYPDSAALWVGCEGDPDVVTFTLDRRFRTLRGVVGFRAGLGAGVTAQVVVSADGRPVSTFHVDHDGGYPLALVVTDVTALTFATTRHAGECRPSDDSYLVVADGTLQ